MIKSNMAPAARSLADHVMAVQAGEKALIVTDSGRSPSITEALAHAIAGAGAKLAIIEMPPHPMGGVDPPAHVTAAVQASDVVFFQTTSATFHTDTMRGAIARGTRILEMWGFEEEMMVTGPLGVDYAKMERVTQALASLMTEGKTGRFTTPEGTDVSFSIEGCRGMGLLQLARNPGECCACPGGEAAVCPLMGSTEGVLVNPFSIEHRGLGFVTEPMRIEVRAGKAHAITGSPAGERFWGYIVEAGELARNVAEFAIGTNNACRKRFTVREAKKAVGTCHMAFGDSRSLGGDVNVPFHVDMIYDNPTVWFDERMVMKDGKILV